MNALPVAPPVFAPAQAHLTGPALLAARLVWAAAALLALISIIAGTPVRHTQLATVTSSAVTLLGQLRPEDARLLSESGLTTEAYAAYFTAVELMTVLIAFGVAGLIAWGRSADWMALFMSLFLIAGTAVLPLVSTLETAHPLWSVTSVAWRAAFIGSLIPLLYLFPNGRWVPAWTRWLTLAWLAYTLLWLFFPRWAPPSGFGRGLTVADAPPLVWALIWLIGGVLAQLWRYFRVSSALDRQRTKWVVLGFAVLLVLFAAGVVTLTYVSSATAGFGYAAARLAGPTLILVGFQVVAISVGGSVLRYRLWDIDVIIRRTLIYSVLSAGLALTYFGSVLLLEGVFRALTGQGQNSLVVVLSTLAIAALFVPLRSRLQRWIDRRFYRHKYDAVRTLARFAASARDETDLEQLSTHLMAVVNETVQPAHVGLWLKGKPARPAPPRPDGALRLPAPPGEPGKNRS